MSKKIYKTLSIKLRLLPQDDVITASIAKDGITDDTMSVKDTVRIFSCKVWLRKSFILFSRLEGFRDMTEG